MKTIQDKSLRKVAILVASLDEAWSDRILSTLSPQQARSVRLQLDQLTDVDPDEQRRIVAEFRQSLAQPVEHSSTGVELEASLQERIDHNDYSPVLHQPTHLLQSLSVNDAEFLVEMLKSESAQTIAVVLSRLDPSRAAELLNKLPAAQQTDILDRLGELDTTDEHAVRVIEAQVTQWIHDHRRRQERMAAGREMVERIMSRTTTPDSPNHATVIAGRLPKATASVASEYRQSMPQRETLRPPLRYEPLPKASQPAPQLDPFAQLTAAECQTRIEKLSDEALLGALSQCESQVVSLALVGTGEKTLKRVLRGLPRREAKAFRQQLRDIGPIRLSDLLAAQQEVLRQAAAYHKN
jgi:flagellar motor switch protein FliG